MLSAVIITKNEAVNIGRCIASLQGLADEVLVVDSQSVDETAAIAESLGARVLQRPFDGFGTQKAWAIEQAAHDWILSVDADEEVTPELKSSLLTVKGKEQAPGYHLNRITNYCGRWIRHCGWYPELRLLYFNRTQGHMSTDAVHEGWVVADPKTVGQLGGDLRHYSFPTISAHLKKIEQYSELGARVDFAKGRRAGLFKLLMGPKWTFFRMFVLQHGFMDGYWGWVLCRNSAFAAWAKYSKLRALWMNKVQQK